MANENSNQEQTMKAVITREASKKLNKSNGAVYVLHNAKVIDGPLAGMVVTAQRTILNKDKVEKKGVNVEQEVVLFMRVVENEEGKKMPFFEISTTEPTASAEDILAKLGARVETTATADSQSI